MGELERFTKDAVDGIGKVHQLISVMTNFIPSDPCPIINTLRHHKLYQDTFVPDIQDRCFKKYCGEHTMIGVGWLRVHIPVRGFSSDEVISV